MEPRDLHQDVKLSSLLGSQQLENRTSHGGTRAQWGQQGLVAKGKHASWVFRGQLARMIWRVGWGLLAGEGGPVHEGVSPLVTADTLSQCDIGHSSFWSLFWIHDLSPIPAPPPNLSYLVSCCSSSAGVCRISPTWPPKSMELILFPALGV